MQIIRHAVRRAADPRQSLGFRIDVPPGLKAREGCPGVHLCLVHETADGRLHAEMDLVVFAAPLVVDRAGVLDDVATSVAGRFLEPPRAGRVLDVEDVAVAGQSARCIRVRVERGERGEAPALPYQTAIVLEPPDAAIQAALLVITRTAAADWPAGDAALASLRLDGGRARVSGGVALPLTF